MPVVPFGWGAVRLLQLFLLMRLPIGLISRYMNMQGQHSADAFPCTSAELAMLRIRDGLASGSGVIPLALANSKAHSVGAQLAVEPEPSSASVSGTRVTLSMPAAVFSAADSKQSRHSNRFLPLETNVLIAVAGGGAPRARADRQRRAAPQVRPGWPPDQGRRAARHAGPGRELPAAEAVR